MKAIVVLESTIIGMRVIFIEVSGDFRAAEALLHAVLVDAPQIVDTVVNSLLVAVLAENGWRSGEESHILESQLENG